MPSDRTGGPEPVGCGRGRGWWFLGGLAVVLVGIVAGGTLFERSSPARIGAGEDGVGPPATAVTPAVIAASAIAGGGYVFPVGGTSSYVRTHHDYPATDILAPCGTAVVAVTAGVILEVSRTDPYDARVDDGASRGGLFVSLLGDDGVRYYGSHLSSVSVGVDRGTRVSAGQRIGVVGATGRAGACHLHFGISPPCARVGDWWVRRGVEWPWSYLDSWRRGGSASPASAIAAWTRKHGCPGAPMASAR